LRRKHAAEAEELRLKLKALELQQHRDKAVLERAELTLQQAEAAKEVQAKLRVERDMLNQEKEILAKQLTELKREHNLD
jgi:hypothetical protein